MANHPLNLALRFLMELFALFALGYWGWTQYDGWLRIVLAIGAPLLAAVLWGTFRVPNDPGKAPVAVPGWVRLGLEALFFSAAVLALNESGRSTWAWIFAIVIAIHYALSYDRLNWLLER